MQEIPRLGYLGNKKKYYQILHKSPFCHKIKLLISVSIFPGCNTSTSMKKKNVHSLYILQVPDSKIVNATAPALGANITAYWCVYIYIYSIYVLDCPYDLCHIQQKHSQTCLLLQLRHVFNRKIIQRIFKRLTVQLTLYPQIFKTVFVITKKKKTKKKH